MRKIRLLTGLFVMLPHIICLIISKYLGGKIVQDLHRWKEIKGIKSNDILAFVYLLMVY